MNREVFLLHELLLAAAERAPHADALTAGSQTWGYGDLCREMESFAGGVRDAGLQRGDRVAIYMEKRREAVVASFGAAAGGCVFVPINPLLKPAQVAYILSDCNVRMLVTTAERYDTLREAIAGCTDLRHIVIVGEEATLPAESSPQTHSWAALCSGSARSTAPSVDADMAAILYTSGSTGKPKDVVLSHRNLVTDARSVSSYLDNNAGDSILAVLPLSFDAGFSQLTTAF